MQRFILGTFNNRPARSSRLISSAVESLEPRRLLSVTFGSATLLNGFPINPYAVVDLNGDGKPDIVGLGEQGQGIEIYVNQGNGTFGQAIVVPNSTGAAIGLAIGDFNGDGVPDIAVMSGNATVSCFLGAGVNVNGTNPSYLAPVVSSYALPASDIVSQQAVIQPAPTGTTTINADTSVSQLQTAHFGGTMDDLVVDDAANGNRVQVLLATGGGSFQTDTANILAGPGDAEPSVGRFVVADFSGDGISDIAYSEVVGNAFGIIVQFGAIGGTFLTSEYPYSVPSAAPVDFLAAPLASPSALPDLICNSDDFADLDVLLNNGAGSFAPATAYPVTDSQDISVGDFDDDGSLDISAGSQILFNTGAGTFSPAQDIDGLANVADRVSADLNGDGYADMVDGGSNVQLEGASNNGGGSTGGGGTIGGGGTTSSSGFTGQLTGPAPSSTIAGQKVKISQKLFASDSSAFTGSVTAALYLSSNGTIDSNSILLDSQTKKNEKLKANKPITFNLKASSTASTTPNGTYQLISQITDSSGTTDVTGSSVTVAPAQIDLAGSFSKQPVAGKNGKTKLSLSVTNSGNTAASGLLKINIDSSAINTTAGASVLSSPSKKINIKPGSKPQKISLPSTLPAGTYFLVIQLDPDNAFNDVNLANNIFATSSEITVG